MKELVINIELLKSWIPDMIKLMQKSGKAILEIYQGEFSFQSKEDDSPVTEADLVSSRIISEGLRQFSSDVLIISEESTIQPFSIRSKEKYIWLLDPLDGTSEFIKKNDEFVISLALIENHRPILGMLYAPVSGSCYYAISEGGAFFVGINGISIKLPLFHELTEHTIRILVSRSHRSELDDQLISLLKGSSENIEEFVVGSALKFGRIADGSADLYPKFGPTMEWDTAAGHLILTETGGEVFSINCLEPLSYNKENLRNDYFIACKKEFYIQLRDLVKKNFEHL